MMAKSRLLGLLYFAAMLLYFAIMFSSLFATTVEADVQCVDQWGLTVTVAGSTCPTTIATTGAAPTTGTGGDTGATISASLCGIVNQISEVIGILALLLFIVGGTMYAAAHLLPAAGNLRGNLQGWSMGMIVGGVVGLILVLLAPSLLNIIATAGGVTTNLIPTAGCGTI